MRKETQDRDLLLVPVDNLDRIVQSVGMYNRQNRAKDFVPIHQYRPFISVLHVEVTESTHLYALISVVHSTTVGPTKFPSGYSGTTVPRPSRWMIPPSDWTEAM